MLALAAPYGETEAQPESSEKLQTASLHEIKNAILSATGYNSETVELAATTVQFVVTLVNSKLIDAAPFKREDEASQITSVIANAAASKPEFRAIQAIHIDYVKGDADGGHSRTIDGIDFRKDPEGKFQHHVS